MQITINEQEIDVQLQSEKNAGEVVKALDSWLREQGFALIGLKINGEDRDIGSVDWRGIPVKELSNLDLDAPSMSELRKANLEILYEYAQSMHDALLALSGGTNTISTIRDLISGFDQVRPAMVYLSNASLGSQMGSDNQIARDMERLIETSSRNDGSFNAEILPEFAGVVYSLVVLSKDRLKEIADPVREAQTAGLVLESLIPDLSTVSTRLLTGKEKEAYDTIFRFSELMSKLLRLFWLMVERQQPGSEPPFSQTDLQNWTGSVNQTLEQIGHAIDSQDTVLLGDILEYELPEQIEALVQLIPGHSKENR